jgi:AsmA protein
MKKALIVASVIIVLLIVIVIALPFFVDANRFKPTLESDLSAALGRPVLIGTIQLALFSGGVTVDNISIADDPAFSHEPFLQASKLTAGVALMPLLFSRQLQVNSFTVTNPQVALLRSPTGTWNFSSLGHASAEPPNASPASGSNFSVQKFKITNGAMTIGTIGSGGKTQNYQDVNFEASDFSYTSQFSFQLSAMTPGNGKVAIDGKAGPINTGDASLTALDAKIDVENLDLALTGFVAPSAGVGGLIDFNAMLSSDGKQMTSTGTVKADKMKLAAGGGAAKVPVNVQYTATYDLKGQSGSLQQGEVSVGKALSHLTGTFDTAGTSTSVKMKLAGQGMSVPDLEGILPAVGVALPSGASLQTGALDVNLAINGPVDKLVITGPIKLSNAKLAGFNLGSQLGALSSFAGLGHAGTSDTDIQTLSADVRVDPSGTNAQNLNLILPSIGTITGNGTVSATGQLNCQMVAKLSASGNPVTSLTSALSSFTGGSKSLSSGIPFKITGSTAHPVFVPDVAGALKNVVKGGAGSSSNAANTAAGIVGGLFGKKKSQ